MDGNALCSVYQDLHKPQVCCSYSSCIITITHLARLEHTHRQDKLLPVDTVYSRLPDEGFTSFRFHTNKPVLNNVLKVESDGKGADEEPQGDSGVSVGGEKALNSLLRTEALQRGDSLGSHTSGNGCWFVLKVKCWNAKSIMQARCHYPTSEGDTRKCFCIHWILFFTGKILVAPIASWTQLFV